MGEPLEMGYVLLFAAEMAQVIDTFPHKEESAYLWKTTQFLTMTF